MSFRANECESRNLPEWQTLSCGGSSSNVVDSSTPLRSVGMTMLVRFYGFARCFCNISRCPAALIRLAHRASQLPPREAFVPCFWAVSFNRTGYICHAPGTAHRPFPTVSLKRSASAPIVPAMFHAVPHCPPLPVVGMTVRDTFYRPKPT